MLKSVKLKNYRNLNSLEIQINSKSTIIIAPNSSGKTNLLESIYFSIYGSPFKTIESLSEVIGKDESFAKIITTWDDFLVEVIVSKTEGKLKKNYLLNSKSTSLKKLSSLYSAVIFAPDSVDLISGDPNLRRHELDNFLSSISSSYYSNILTYNKVLKNRNALLKAIRENGFKRKELSFWTDKLVEKAEFIFNFRQEFFNNISPFITQTVKEMGIFLKGDEFKELRLEYLPSIPKSSNYNFIEQLKMKFADNVEKEIIVGKTLYGIHKDDYGIFIGEKNMRYFGSRGQQRLSTFLVKLSQITYFEKILNRKPLFLIDDLMSELDSSNRQKIAQYLISTDIQFILTSAEDLEVPTILKDLSTIVLLNE